MTIRGISNTAPYTGQNARNDIHNQLTALWNSVPLVPTGVSGTNTILGTCDPPIAGYVDGQSFFLTMVGANSSTTVNVNIDGKGNRPLVDPDNVALPVNTTAAGRNELVRYNATLSKFILMRATRLPWDMQVAASDETSAIAAATNKVRWRMPRLITGMSVRASLATAQTSGSIFTVDIHKNGVSILSTKLTIDNTEKTSVTAATAAVISDTVWTDDAEFSIDVDQIGDGTARGLKVVLLGTTLA